MVHQASEESDASAMGIWLQLVVGKDEQGAQGHAWEHSWRSLDSVLRHLGLERDTGVPLWLNPRVKARIHKRLLAAGFPSPWGTE